MRKYLLITIVAFASLVSFGQSYQMTHDKNRSILTTQHLNLIFSDLIEKNLFSKNTVLILDNYDVLRDCKLQKKSYNFQVVDKSRLNRVNTNNILFWRMDVSDTKAHYEFYLNKSKAKSVKYDYRLQLKNGNWEILNK
ncbi:MAG: hypothetical protein ABF274_04040 [Nonlabens sp.]|uniref:hypothetical protein n=1 Tax=Nonlabens sp. TaxID=1888209 RepID=UPI00321B68D1